MSSPHLTLLTEPQVDIPGSPFFLSPIYLHSPQPSPISPLITQSPVADPNFFWYENLYDTTVFLPKLDQGGISPSLLDGDVVEHFPPHTSHTPSTIDLFQSSYPSVSDFDDGSTPSLSTSPVMQTAYICQTCICGCGGSACIDQRPYRRPKGDPLEDYHNGELITFRVNGQCGMPLKSALDCMYGGLIGRDDPMFLGSKSSISIRLEWLDCPSWTQQMRTKDWKRKPSPISKAKLATEVAKKVKRFLEDMRPNHRGFQGDPLSPSRIDFDRLTLVALEHVSMGSWQPHLRLI